MKKIASIAGICILIFNWGGFRLLSAWLEQRSEFRLDAKLDNDEVTDAQLIYFRFPLTYKTAYSHISGFERADGQVTVAGNTYKLVKRRLFGDSVELMCIVDHAAARILSARDDFFRLVNDLQHSADPSHHPANGSQTKLFDPGIYLAQEWTAGCTSPAIRKHYPRHYFQYIPEAIIRSIDRPPNPQLPRI